MCKLWFDVLEKGGCETGRFGFLGAVLFLLLACVFLMPLAVRQVKASEAIYIRADGSIDPSTSPVSTVDNITYVLTGGVTSDVDGIIVERDSAFLDGAGHELQGSGTGAGVNLSNVNNVTIKNMGLRNFSSGIMLNYSSGDTVSGNNITANTVFGIYVFGSLGDDSLLGNTVTDNYRGITLDSSSNDSIVGNIIANSDRGIDIYFSSNNSISLNDIDANDGTGIHIESSSNGSSIFGNTITNNGYGIAFEYSCTGNNVFENILTNDGVGVYLEYSAGNRFYHNIFVNNTNQVQSYNSVNIWDDGYPSGGNYWSGYTGADVKSGPYQNETGSDRIGDAPLVIDANNTDHYPLMTQYAILEFPRFLILPLFMATTLLVVTVYKRKHSLKL